MQRAEPVRERCRINRPSRIDPVTGEPTRRDQHDSPGTPGSTGRHPLLGAAFVCKRGGRDATLDGVIIA